VLIFEAKLQKLEQWVADMVQLTKNANPYLKGLLAPLAGGTSKTAAAVPPSVGQ
jgi:hypothetical protein